MVVATAQRVLAGSSARSMESDFAQIYAAQHAKAVRLAYLLCGDADRAEDEVADAFVKVYRRWKRGGIDDPGPYIRRAVVNQVNSRFRRLAVERREARKLSGDERGTRTVDEHFADTDVLVTALATLPARQRTAIVLRYYADLSLAETAEAMDISVGTVKSTVSRGMENLRTAMGEGDAR